MGRAFAIGVGAAAILVMTEGLAQQAEQPPAWANLAECSAVFSTTADAPGYSGTPTAEIKTMRRVATRFRSRAVEVARQMGQADPEADVASIMVYLVPRWENRIERLTAVSSNLDWIAYCGRLGREYGVINR